MKFRQLTMRFFYFLIVAWLIACGGNTQEDSSNDADSTENQVVAPGETDSAKLQDPASAHKTYANERFRSVTVQKNGTNRFVIEGEAQVFEANISWVVEDGHQELKEGFVTTDAGAPAWGRFTFAIDVEKQRPNSALTLILFETSMKDGSRQHELPIPLIGPTPASSSHQP